LRGPAVVPGLERVIAGVECGIGVEGIGEMDEETMGGDVEGVGEVEGFTGIADAVELAGFGFIARPAVEAGGVEVSVIGVEDAAHEAGIEFQREAGESALAGILDLLVEDEEHLSHAVGESDELVGEWAPAVIGDPEVSASGAIDEIMDPAKGRVEVVAGGGILPGPEVTVEAAWFDPVDAVGGHPMALIIDGGEFAVGSDAEAVDGAEATGDDFGGVAIG